MPLTRTQDRDGENRPRDLPGLTRDPAPPTDEVEEGASDEHLWSSPAGAWCVSTRQVRPRGEVHAQFPSDPSPSPASFW